MTNKWLYSLIAVGVLLALGVGVYAYNSGGPPSVMGHSAEELNIILECVSGSHTETDSPGTSIFESTKGNTYSFSDIFQAGDTTIDGMNAPTLTCVNGWTMTGCSADTINDDSSDNDERMIDSNTCVGNQNGGQNVIYARCCKLG